MSRAESFWEDYEDEPRRRYSGIFAGFGKRVIHKGFTATTVLLVEIKNVAEDVTVAHYGECNLTNEFLRLFLEKGDVVEFDARLLFNEDDNRPGEVDCWLSRPTRITRPGTQSKGAAKRRVIRRRMGIEIQGNSATTNPLEAPIADPA